MTINVDIKCNGAMKCASFVCSERRGDGNIVSKRKVVGDRNEKVVRSGMKRPRACGGCALSRATVSVFRTIKDMCPGENAGGSL